MRKTNPEHLNYFGNLIKKETGKTAPEYILLKTMDLAAGAVGK